MIKSIHKKRNAITRCFKWQLHIPVVIFVLRASMHIMYVEELYKGKLTVFLLVLSIVLKNSGEFQ